MASSPAGAQARVVFGARGSRRRRLWIVFSAVALVLITGAIATGATLRHLDNQYGPIESGEFFGMYHQRGFVSTKDGSRFRLSRAPNATGQLIASLDNRGSHSVRVTSIEPMR